MSWGYAILYTLAPLGQNHLTSNPYITDTCTTNGLLYTTVTDVMLNF